MTTWDDPAADIEAWAEAYRHTTGVTGPVSFHTAGIDGATDGAGVPVHEAVAAVRVIEWLAAVWHGRA